ncbi:hypothetical protein BDI4_700032 [Burkholderia diffusa]|nr:hypothetical protein BDI4_700032 [Burkholderia diffusa]
MRRMGGRRRPRRESSESGGQNRIVALSRSADGLFALRQDKKIFIFYKDLERLK